MSLLVYGPVAAFGFVAGTLVEYITHRAMHSTRLLRRRHSMHHSDAGSQGVLWELRDYALGGATFIALLGITGLAWPGVHAFLAGGLIQTACAAWAHQLHHEKPAAIFWMRAPIHRQHHEHRMMRQNFGITVDWWDRIFGTYAPIPRDRVRSRAGDLFRIRWL